VRIVFQEISLFVVYSVLWDQLIEDADEQSLVSILALLDPCDFAANIEYIAIAELQSCINRVAELNVRSGPVCTGELYRVLRQVDDAIIGIEDCWGLVGRINNSEVVSSLD